MLAFVYFDKAQLPSLDDTLIKVTTSIGTLLGQIIFGVLADRYGRTRMYGYELVIIILATLGQSFASQTPAISITGLMVFWRVVMGLGIGGDYPLSNVIISEYVLSFRDSG